MVEKIATGELLEISNGKRVFFIGTRLTQRALDWRVRTAFSSVFFGSNQFR